jgi:leucyl aminopeptidase
MLPPNALTPTIYREKVEQLAKENGWKHQAYDMKKLKKMGAGAFVAVGQGSEPQDAAIVHLTYSPKSAKKHVALVGKGICFDTGGHNLKSAKYMQGMHEDMNGSAVALGILLAATQAKIPVKIDCWLAIAQNHIGPLAYKQNDVVTALNGTTIEVVHTDAEGRMVLADTLTLASREKPDLMLDFATLTGSMVGALGNRYSGILGNRPELLGKAVSAGTLAGERVNAFPFDEDYEEELESSVADIKQCTIDSEADHILAARFLYKFIEHKDDIAWLHMDLSSYNRKGGLGAVASDVNGFGVGFSLALIKAQLS